MAKSLYHKRKTEALQGVVLPENLRRKHVAFSEIAEDAMEYSRLHKRSHRSDEVIKTTLVDLFGTHGADALTGVEIEELLAVEGKSRGWAASTYNHHRAFLMLAYREAKRNGKAQTNPARDVRHHRENNSRVRFLSRGENSEYVRLVKAIQETSPEHLPEFTFALHTGLRLGSQYAATYEMIDWTRNVLDLPRSKNGEAVHAPLNDVALAAIRSLPSWKERKGPIFRNQRHPDRPVLSNDHWFKPAMKVAGIENFKWHDIRHTFASWLVQDGVPLDRVSKLLGHKGLTMTARYAHLAPSQLAEDVAILTRNSTSVAPSVICDEARKPIALITNSLGA
jgi:integrase